MKKSQLRKVIREVISEQEEENPIFEVDPKTVQNLQYLDDFEGDEQIEELIGLANYILDELKESGTATIMWPNQSQDNETV